MASTPERQNTPSQRPERFDIAHSVIDHAILGTLFFCGLAADPRRTLRALRRDRVTGIYKGYKRFFDNTRAILH